MPPLRVLTWHIHGNYLLYLSQARVEFYLPVRAGGGEGYGGRGRTFPFGSNVHDVPAEAVRDRTFDCVLFQTRKNYEADQYEVLSPAQRRLPRIYLEHDPPITFTGSCERGELRNYYRAADVFVTTPWYEPFGITPVEAMACGTPVIGAAVGGIKATVRDGVTGYLVPPKDPDALAARLAYVAERPRLLQEFGTQALRRARSLYTWQRIGKAIESLYESVLGINIRRAGSVNPPVCSRTGGITAPARRAVFLDKDGTLIEDIPYNVDPQKIQLAPGAVEGLTALHENGYVLIVVSNQSGVAHGFFPERALRAVERSLRRQLAAVGVPLAGFYYCPHHPQGRVKDYTGTCRCRKPAPGMLRRAAADLGIDLAESWMIGDILDDIEAGRRAGCRTVLIDNGNETQWRRGRGRRPHYRASDLAEAARLILTAAMKNQELGARE
jgi:histidinol-phosphate phosphatase family protein